MSDLFLISLIKLLMHKILKIVLNYKIIRIFVFLECWIRTDIYFGEKERLVDNTHPMSSYVKFGLQLLELLAICEGFAMSEWSETHEIDAVKQLNGVLIKMTSRSKNAVRSYEAEIEKSREESNWKKVVDLAQQLKARSPQHGE